jgi:hypothetical protein
MAGGADPRDTRIDGVAAPDRSERTMNVER